MRVAALYDIHGNLPALEAVLADPRCSAADVVVCGGDLCAGPMPREVLSLLQERGALFVRGNGDRELEAWPAGLLDKGALETLRSWPTTVTLEVEGIGDVVFCHGSPRNDDEIITRLSPDAVVAAALADVVADVVVCGHTHVQFDRRVRSTRLLNAGSVGMPFEGRAAAFWALIGPDLELVQTQYDVPAAVAAIRATGYPDADELAETLLSPHSADEASAFFEAQREARSGGA